MKRQPNDFRLVRPSITRTAKPCIKLLPEKPGFQCSEPAGRPSSSAPVSSVRPLRIRLLTKYQVAIHPNMGTVRAIRHVIRSVAVDHGHSAKYLPRATATHDQLTNGARVLQVYPVKDCLAAVDAASTAAPTAFPFAYLPLGFLLARRSLFTVRCSFSSAPLPSSTVAHNKRSALKAAAPSCGDICEFAIHCTCRV